MTKFSKKYPYDLLVSSRSRWLKRWNSSPLHRLSSVVLLLLATRIFSPATPPVASRPPRDSIAFLHNRHDERLITSDPQREQPELITGRTWREVLSWDPRVFLFHQFLISLIYDDCEYKRMMDECEHLINLGKPQMKKSFVADPETGNITQNSRRTSRGTFLDMGQDDIVKRIEERIAAFTFIPVENGENLQILHYEIGEKYEAHYDYFKVADQRGERKATLIMYLMKAFSWRKKGPSEDCRDGNTIQPGRSDVEEGGETVFPFVLPDTAAPHRKQLSRCGKGGLAVRPNMGDALLFWNMTPDLMPDRLSLHESCPVIKGSKWAATKWMHVKEFRN